MRDFNQRPRALEGAVMKNPPATGDVHPEKKKLNAFGETRLVRTEEGKIVLLSLDLNT